MAILRLFTARDTDDNVFKAVHWWLNCWSNATATQQQRDAKNITKKTTRYKFFVCLLGCALGCAWSQLGHSPQKPNALWFQFGSDWALL